MICQGILFKLKCNLILPRSSAPIRTVKTVDSQLCNVFPNPVSESLEIQINKHIQSEISIRVIDVFGQYVHLERVTPRDQSATIDVSGFIPGIYFLVVVQENRIVETHKIAVIHY